MGPLLLLLLLLLNLKWWVYLKVKKKKDVITELQVKNLGVRAERKREMSLVDYTSSSEDEEEDAELTNKEDEEEAFQENRRNAATQDTHRDRSISSLQQPSDRASHLTTTSVGQLPDASLLLNSPAFSSQQMSGTDHYSRVAAAMAENASRKRESNGSVSSNRRSKNPRSNLPHSRNVPDTVSGSLVPPQLSGRSNVVTEDLGRLFARRNPNPSLRRSPEQLS